MKKTFVLPLLLVSFLTISGYAQKFGYTNSVALLSELPEVQQADADLKTYQAQLTKKGQEMVKELQDEDAELERKKSQGIIAPKDYDAQAAKLKEKEDAIGAYEQQVYADLSKRREELYKPILEKVNTAMQDVAKEGGYLIVFDVSTQILLYADESLDVTKLVKAKLGIANTEAKATGN